MWIQPQHVIDKHFISMRTLEDLQTFLYITVPAKLLNFDFIPIFLSLFTIRKYTNFVKVASNFTQIHFFMKFAQNTPNLLCK